MKEFRMRAFFGIVGLAAAGFLLSSVTTVGCGSDSKGGSGGSGGSGNTTGTAGTTGGGGTTGGSGGGGGTTATVGCEVSDPGPGAPLISDFMTADVTTLPIGGTFVYPASGGPMAVVDNGAWHITATTTGMTGAQYWGAGIYFNGNTDGTHCVDATAYTGVEFDISGTVGGTGCTVQFSTNDSIHADAIANPTDKKAGGAAGSYAPQKTITIAAAVTNMKIPFTGADAPANGSPNIDVNKAKLVGVQWQFTTAAGTTNSCMVDIKIDNVKFY